jgi:starvation-inducible outer membrane lipoprotein
MAPKVVPVSLGWLTLAILALAFAITGCSKSPDACERLAARLMPNPDATFVETCRAESALDPSYTRMVECVLAIEGGVTETELKTCPGSDKLLFFQF